MIQRDYIMRQIEMLTRVVARLLQLKEQKKYEVALKEIGDVYDELFAAEARLLKIVDTTTAACILGHWERVKIFATLRKEEAEIFKLKNEMPRALEIFQQAKELFLKTLEMKGSPDQECLDLAAKIDTEMNTIRL